MPLQLQSLVRPDGQLQLSLADVPQPQPVHPDDVVIRVEAAPVNPSDLGNLLAGADVQQATRAGSAERPVVTAPLSPAALAATDTRLLFDATGGGTLIAQVLAAMEAALLRRPGLPYSRYGSQIHKQAYVYGFLQRGAIELPPGFGFSWSLSGWLLFPFMQQLAPERLAALKQRVADELTSTFASHYEREASLAELLTPEALQYCARMGTGQKLLVRPAPG